MRKRIVELYKISMPLLFENLFITLMGIISTVMVASVGQHAISAVGMIDAVSNLIISVFSALTVGGTIVVAQYCGRGSTDDACRAGAQAIVISAVLSAFILLVLAVFRASIIDVLYGRAEPDVIYSANQFMAIVNFSYPLVAVLQTIFGVMRGSGDTATPMKISVLMNILNVLIGRTLILGLYFIPALGVAGAAYGLLLSRLIGLVVAAFYIMKRSKTVRINKLSYFKPDFAVQKVILHFGVPTSIENVLFQIGRMITQIFVVSMGTAAIMANSVSMAINGFMNVPGTAITTAVMILVGQRIGRGDVDDVKKTIKFAAYACCVSFGALCLAFFPMMGFFLRLYNADAEAAGMIRQVLSTCYIATPLFWSFSFVISAGLRAAGDVRYTMVVSVLTMFSVRIFTGYALGLWLGFGVVGVWVGMYSDWFVRGIVYFVRLRSDKWKGKKVI